MSEIRRVVTGLDAGDKAVAVLDSTLPLNPGRSANPAAVLWITDTNPAGYSSADTAKPIGIPPPDNGSIFRVVEFLPTTDAEIAKIDHTHMTSVIGDKTPGADYRRNIRSCTVPAASTTPSSFPVKSTCCSMMTPST